MKTKEKKIDSPFPSLNNGQQSDSLFPLANIPRAVQPVAYMYRLVYIPVPSPPKVIHCHPIIGESSSLATSLSSVSLDDVTSATDQSPGDMKCVMCLDQYRAIAFVPCGHCCCCCSCTRTLMTSSTGRICPVCRSTIENVLRVFFNKDQTGEVSSRRWFFNTCQYCGCVFVGFDFINNKIVVSS